ncbi:MAG: hypothetical protein MJ219_04010 [Mycoplasmoidaceae bacterium]|nr:hypothetical protein [Mycoplasmoidaceae bacterium]
MERKVKKIAPNITPEQIEQIRRQLSSAINAYGREVPNRYMYDRAVDGIKYKSSSSDELFVTVPTLTQKHKVKK